MSAMRATQHRQKARRNGSSGSEPMGFHENPVYTGELADELECQLDEGEVPSGTFRQVVRFGDSIEVVTIGEEVVRHYWAHIRHTDAHNILIAEKRAQAVPGNNLITFDVTYRSYVVHLVSVLRQVQGREAFALRGRHESIVIAVTGSLGLRVTYSPADFSYIPEGDCELTSAASNLEGEEA